MTLDQLIGWFWIFVVGQLIAGFLFYQHDHDNEANKLFLKHRSSAPFLLLQLGMVMYIALLSLYFVYLVDENGCTETIPNFVDGKDLSPSLVMFFELITMVLVNVLPWIGFIWMWYAFFKSNQSVWEKDSKKIVGVFDVVSSPTSFIGRWDDYRYGRFADEGVSFVPYWQPVLIMWSLTLVALVLSAANISRFFRI